MSRGASLRMLLVSLSLCACGDHGPQSTEHPQEALISADFAPDDSIDLGADPPPDTAPKPAWLAFAHVTRIGVLEQPEQQVFGTIDRVLITPDSQLLVLDSKAMQARLFSLAGQYDTTLGRPGEGPGDFSSPRTAALDSAGRLYIGDLGRRVQVFLPAGHGYTLDTVLQTGISPKSMCVLHDRLIVQGVTLGDTNSLHIFDLRGRPLASGAPLYHLRSPIINYTVSEARIACDSTSDVIVLASPLLGEVRGYHLDLTLAWRTKLAGYRSAVVRELPDEGFGVTFPPDGYNRMESLVALPGGRSLAQVSFITDADLKSGATPARVQSVLLDDRDGAGAVIADTLPIYAAISSTVAVEITENSYPRLTVRH